MGCHTWFYDRLVKQPIYEKCKKVVLDTYRYNLKYYKRLKNKKELTEEDIQDMETWSLTPDRLDFQIKLTEKLISKIEQGGCEDAVRRRYAHFYFSPKTGVIRYHNGIFYGEHSNLPHDVFRVTDYPEDVLSSYEDFENFYSTHKCYPPNSDEVRHEMWKFWEEHPNGLVDFG